MPPKNKTGLVDGDESHGIPIRQKKSPTKQIHVPFQSWFVVGKTHLEVIFLFANAQNVLEKNKKQQEKANNDDVVV